MSKVSDHLKKFKAPKRRTEPLWEGPESDGPQGGVTQSLLGRFLSCRERFRLKVVEGLQANEGFNPRLEYGNMWHVCEEALAENLPRVMHQGKWMERWECELIGYCKTLCWRYPLDQSKIEHWYSLCKAFFPLYVKHWAEHPDVKERMPLLQEETFKVPYKLPSGRTVYLRGKWDAVDLIGKGKAAGVYIQENKTKSSIDAQKIMRTLKFDLQTMLYMAALQATLEKATKGGVFL